VIRGLWIVRADFGCRLQAPGVPAHALPVPPAALDRVAALASGQGGVITWRQSVEAGLTASQVRTLVRRGTWTGVGDGVMAIGPASPLALAAGRLWSVQRRAVISHDSAGVLHGIPYVDPPSEGTLTVERATRGLAGIYVGALPSAHVTHLSGLPITTPARTLVDLLRTATGRGAAQALADGVLHRHLHVGDVDAVLRACPRWPGIRQARGAWACADPRSESPLESRHRVVFRDAGLPEPELQAAIHDGQGRSARVDFLFREHRVVVESDGKVKYVDKGSSDDADRSTSDALWWEKQREDWLRELGFEVVRATWADLADGGVDLVHRVLRAFGRAGRRAA